MKLLSKWNVLTFALVAMMCIGMSSCSKSDSDPDPEPPIPSSPTRITVTNNGTYTLERFRIIFLNSSRESLTDKDCGTLAPHDQASAPIPTAANEYYMATYIFGNWFFSPYYSISYSNLSITDAEIGQWRSN